MNNKVMTFSNYIFSGQLT